MSDKYLIYGTEEYYAALRAELWKIDEGIWLATRYALGRRLKKDLEGAKTDENEDSAKLDKSEERAKSTIFTHVIGLVPTGKNMKERLKTGGVKVLQYDDVQDKVDMDWKVLLKRNKLNDFLAEFKDAWDKHKAKQNLSPPPELVVYCFGAQTRSAFVLAYALIKFMGLNTYEALRKVSEMRTGRGFVWQFEEGIQALEDYGGKIQGKREDLFVTQFWEHEGNLMRVNMDYNAVVTCSKPICKL